MNKGEEGRFEEELAKDVLEIITVFSARHYGSRSRKNKKLLEDMHGTIARRADKWFVSVTVDTPVQSNSTANDSQVKAARVL